MTKPRDTWRPVPFVAWLSHHKLLHPGCAWSATYGPEGAVFRRDGSPSRAWPADKIAGPLVVRPKRHALEKAWQMQS